MKQEVIKNLKDRYFEGRGGRKNAVARARIFAKKTGLLVNDKDYKEYFKMPLHQEVVFSPLKILNRGDLGAVIRVKGGGLSGQAGAVRHALSRALVKQNPEFKISLRRAGFLTRDPRVVERKKYGLKKARKGPQWAKR